MRLCYAAYFDASGKAEGFQFMTVAGAVAPIKKWIRFKRDWSDVLRSEGVSEFHATDFACSQGEYRAWKNDKIRRSKFLKQLIKIIKENTNKLFTVTAEIDKWKSVNSEYLLEETFHSPYALLGLSVVCQALNWAKGKKVRSRSQIKLFFEDGDEGWSGLQQLCQKFNNFEPVRLPRGDAVPFQVGDLISWKSRIAATNALLELGAGNLQGIYDELASLDSVLVRPGHRSIYSYEYLVKTCETFKVPKRPLLEPKIKSEEK